MSGMRSFQINDIPTIVKANFGLGVTVQSQLDSYDDQNFLVQVNPKTAIPDNIKTCCPHGYVVKILNAEDSKNSEIIDVQTKMILHLAQQGFPTPTPVLGVNGRYQEEVQAVLDTDQGCIRTTHIVRLFEFKPGKALDKVRLTTQLCHEIGSSAGKLDLILKTFSITDVASRGIKNKWNLLEVPSLRKSTHVIESAEQRLIIEKIIDDFEECLLTNQHSFSRGLIHNDLNECNILVDQSIFSSKTCTIHEQQNGHNNNLQKEKVPDGEYHLCGIIDFGDATYCPYIFEVAIAMAYAMLNKHGISPTDAAQNVLKGYLEHMKLEERELEHLRLIICARFAQSLIMSHIAFSKESENEYILLHTNRIWPVLKYLWQKSNGEVLNEIRTVN